MTTFTDFVPTANAPFQFFPVLDGQPHTLVVTWGLAGQRWYVNLYDVNGLVFYLPLIGSPDGIATSSLTWNVTTQLVTITTALPHNLIIGSLVEQTITGVLPISYNGIVDVVPTGINTLVYPQFTDPGGNATVQGTIGRDINIGAGYLQTSTLVFRETTQQFEVTP